MKMNVKSYGISIVWNKKLFAVLWICFYCYGYGKYIQGRRIKSLTHTQVSLQLKSLYTSPLSFISFNAMSYPNFSFSNRQSNSRRAALANFFSLAFPSSALRCSHIFKVAKVAAISGFRSPSKRDHSLVGRRGSHAPSACTRGTTFFVFFSW